jgi:hypothetical protein
MKKFILLICVLVSTQTFAGGISDSIGDVIAHLALARKVGKIYDKAISCTPLEMDKKYGINVTDWKEIEPEAPHWHMLDKFSSVAPEARDYALKKGGSDKVMHCFAGCYVARKLDLTSGIYLGWYKELVDASDCTTNTRFEKADYDATHAGAIIGSKGRECDSFCGRSDIKNLDGDQMLEVALREE